MTLGMEIDFVWASNWSLMKVLFLIQRYLPFFDTVWLVLHHQLGHDLSGPACHRIYQASGWMYIVGFATSELILTLRAWAVWNRDRRLSITLPMLYVGIWGSDCVIMAKFLASMKFGAPPHVDFLGCFVTKGSSILYLCWVVLMVYEAIILILMIIPGIAAYRLGGDSALYKTVYRDGVLYYLCLFVLSLTNVIVIQILPSAYINLFSSFERVIHSIVTSRVILHIRDHASGATRWSDGVTDLHVDIDSDVSFSEHFMELMQRR
ncbi:hypothetical protein BDQ12DRAFT_479687 [Crucibulum laeve]|uniref:DUF6533 domain-containing protein n=1 Tax=Crucibulum laeve TaxID=68775 RepID=A0A5C3LJ13_9AGAR|nr:hypothetical protein BDQ12DRAFT_479687 [Crucibulum laeve]